MKYLLAPLLLALCIAGARAEVNVTVDAVCDSRVLGNTGTGGGLGMLEVALKLTGSEIPRAVSMRLNIKAAQFEGGEVKEISHAQADREVFRPLRKGKGPEEAAVALGFENPPREIKKLTAISGTIDLLVPENDPTSIITANIAKDAGSPLNKPMLKNFGVEITLTPVPFFSEDNNLGYEIEDPQHKVAHVEFFDPEGRKLEPESSNSTGDGYKKVTTHFAKKPPVGTLVKIYLFTEKSVVSVPLNLADVPLP